MNNSKAVAAAISGLVAGGGAGAVVLPEGSPWYAYLALALAPMVLGYLGTWFAPKNTPS
jgi:hypothetical protein